jgi:acyl carrier protein
MAAESKILTAVQKRLMDIIKKNMESEKEVELKSNLRDELEIDSFGTMMIVDAIEDEFNISVEEADFENFGTVEDIVKVLEDKYLK